MGESIGLIGGSFNPIHYGHLELSEKILDYTDEVWFLPCYQHPFEKDNISFKHRYKMIELALEEIENKKIKVSDFEKRRNKKSTTIDTIKKIREKYPTKEFYWVIGSDIIPELKNWKNYKELIEKTKFLVVKRPDHEPREFPPNYIYLDKVVRIKISSTEIRNKIKENKSIKGLVPNNVESYIKKNNLYS